MTYPQKITELLDLMSENNCRPYLYPMHSIANEQEEEQLIRPSVFHALGLVEKMLLEDLEPLDTFKILKFVVCTHKDNDMQKLLCNSIREEIIFKYIP